MARQGVNHGNSDTAGRASWSWWSNGSTPRDYKAQLKYVDLSAEMGWENHGNSDTGSTASGTIGSSGSGKRILYALSVPALSISWIEAGRASWSWWSNGSTPRDYKAQLKYVDLSAARPASIQDSSLTTDAGFRCETICVWNMVFRSSPMIQIKHIKSAFRNRMSQLYRMQ